MLRVSRFFALGSAPKKTIPIPITDYKKCKILYNALTVEFYCIERPVDTGLFHRPPLEYSKKFTGKIFNFFVFERSKS